MSPLETGPASDPEPGDMSTEVEATERMGRSFWLRCRLSVVQSLTAHVPGTAIHPGEPGTPKYEKYYRTL